MSRVQSRKFQLTLNNPQNHGYSLKTIQEKIASLNPQYACLADEIGAAGTYHTHIFIYRVSPIRFETIKRKFPDAHIEVAYGSCSENRDYITKSGKWTDTDKSETSVPGTFREMGSMPTTEEERHGKSAEIITALESGLSTAQIIKNDPSFIFRSNDIATLRETLLADRFLNEQREVEVQYLYGPTGTGKTRSIFEQHAAESICRITGYQVNGGVRFDAYHGQPVLVFEEFNAQVPITEMLNYLDRYPLFLPARYADRIACYTKVYITSNLPLEAQYLSVQFNKPAVWNAFLRRMTKIIEFVEPGISIEHRVEKYIK